MSCKKGFVAQHHDGVRNILTSLLSKVCKNVQVEPHLQPLDNEAMNLRSATTSSDARLDVKADGFWSRGVTAFFDVRVTHVNSKTNQGKSTAASVATACPMLAKPSFVTCWAVICFWNDAVDTPLYMRA